MFAQIIQMPACKHAKRWSKRHLRVAELRAQDLTWKQIAAKTGVHATTVSKYVQLEDFNLLVRYFRLIHRQQEYQATVSQKMDLILHGELSSLATLIEIASGTVKETYTDEDGNTQERTAAVRPRDRSDAAFKFLEAIGFVAKNKSLGEYYGELMRQNKQPAIDAIDIAGTSPDE